MINIEEYFDNMPLVAILRGVTPDEVVDVGLSLYEEGVRLIEVPLNSPAPFKSIKRLSDALGDKCLCGAGTVVDANDVEKVAEAGGRLIVTPNVNPDVLTRVDALGLVPMPGFATATEAFAAVKAGAKYIKLFPAASYGSGHLRALRAVLPKDVNIVVVGGVSLSSLKEWRDAGAVGVGVGNDIYKPGMSAEDVAVRAEAWVKAIDAAL
ncbi:2-dehydro-3-deoxy-6-phosphogalactonate aldolase [Microbulbifer sp. 2205BS26-8]|uniref:2-dehydro-3-deoxy-6-phosphogalactonate aldolase n=1 Tax=Microbulbifer sp. 2205BS26-8 TaxID=3064386 RepID=UPI00273DCA0A|nr:2-dehydro-3-deoxy-6-phosphogalactonate aldolase [Microbulbifer sp. 2205BS26-8]MDP5210810.1 2-dehydro-3-deoxy-6-phosphogalactonate aldolase [Microbulbifer sp. 2205BS26-8]